MGTTPGGSHVHLKSIDGWGAQLYPCGIATVTPQTFTVASGRLVTSPTGVPQPPAGRGCAPRPTHIRQIWAGGPLRGVEHWFLTYTFPSCWPGPHHLAVLARPGVVRTAPTLPGVSRLRLSSASPDRCDGPAGEGLSPPLDFKRLVAHVVLGPVVPDEQQHPQQLLHSFAGQTGHSTRRHLQPNDRVLTPKRARHPISSPVTGEPAGARSTLRSRETRLTECWPAGRCWPKPPRGEPGWSH